MIKIYSKFDNLEEIKQLLPRKCGVVGVGVTAWPRSALGYLLPNYSILCLLETLDLGAIRQLCPVTSLEKDLRSGLPQQFNTSSILADEKARRWLEEKRASGKSGLFVYKASAKIDRLAAEVGLKILGTPGRIRKIYENKKAFRVEAQKAGIRIPRGETLLVDDLDQSRWDQFRKTLGERLVFQLTDYTVGGGLGTFLVKNKEDFLEFKQFVRRRREGRKIEWVNVTEYIDGRTASMTGCATKHGVVTGVLQAQIIDQPELAALVGRSGVWLGHDWHIHFSEAEQLAAEKVVKKWGERIYRQGYKGIFGLDVVVTKGGEIVVIECNSRYTGAFPVYTMMQLAQGEMPLDVWHLLEWLELDYEMDLIEVQKVSRQPKKGAQLLLHNLERKFVTPTRMVRAGVYRIVSNGSRQPLSPVRRPRQAAGARRGSPSVCHPLPQVEWVRPGFSLLDIKNGNEFVLSDKVMGEKAVLKPAERLGRLLFKRPVVDKKGRLKPEIRQVVRQIYSQFELAPVDKPEGY